VVAGAENEARQELEARAKSVKEALTRVEEALYQTKSKSAEDPLNFPIKLNNKLAGVMASVNGAEFGPTDSQLAVKADLIKAIDEQLAEFTRLQGDAVKSFNALAAKLQVPYVK